MLDNKRCLQHFGNSRQPFHRGQRLGAVEVEARHATACELLFEMRDIARQQHRPGLREAHQQACLAGRMSGCRQDGHRAVTEDVAVAGDRIDFRAAFEPRPDKGRIDREGQGIGLELGKVGGADQQRRLRKCRSLPDMVEMVVTDAEAADLLRFDSDFRELGRNILRKRRSKRCVRIGLCSTRPAGNPASQSI